VRIYVLALLAVLPTGFANADQSHITVQVNPKEIVVSGVSPGSDVYLFGGLQVPHGYYSSLDRVDLTATDDDHDGVVHFPYPKGVPLRSVWVAVDQRNGDLGAGTRTGYPLKINDIPPGAWKRKSGNAVDTLSIAHKALQYLLVHPGEGAWIWAAYQGGSRDEDGQDDRILTISADHMLPSKKSTPKPSHAFPGGGVLVAIDPYTLEIVTSRVPQ
jgi:hypothetical protein